MELLVVRTFLCGIDEQVKCFNYVLIYIICKYLSILSNLLMNRLPIGVIRNLGYICDLWSFELSIKFP